MLPFKDGFYSSTNKQVGGQTVGPETNPDRETIMATLSTAMVGPMDGIYLLNKSRVMATCRADGTVLKPDRPVSVSDACFAPDVSDPASCYTYTTHSALTTDSGKFEVTYVYLDDPKTPITSATIGLSKGAGPALVVYNFYTQQHASFNKMADNVIEPGYEGHVYAIVSPEVNGWHFIGEPSKYVTASAIRFPHVAAGTGSGIKVTVVGAANETVEVCALQATAQALTCQKLQFSSAGTQYASFGTA